MGGIISDILSFIQQYNGALSVLATGILAFLTYKSVKTSRETLEEMRDAREQESRPYLLIEMRASHDKREPAYSKLFLYARNYGKAPAVIESLSVSPEIKQPAGKTAEAICPPSPALEK